jgi:hypothetical protein
MKLNVQNPRYHALALAAVAFCGVNSANPQATGSQAGMQVTASRAGDANASLRAEINILRQELSVLERRVHELETNGGNATSPDDDAPTKKMEQRLAAIEQANAKLSAEISKEESHAGEGSGISHAKAPFVVYDDDGHEIFRVGLGSRSKQPRLTLGNEDGARVIIGASPSKNESWIYLFSDKGDDVPVYLRATGETSSLRLTSAASKQETIIGSATDGRYGVFLSQGETASVTLTSGKSGAGYLGISNSAGQIVAEGASQPNGVGIFRTGPSCCRPPGAIGPHQYIVGKQD